RKGGRAVECTGLENRQERKLFVGSNPTPSARQMKGPRRGPFLFGRGWDYRTHAEWVRHIGRTADVRNRRLPGGRGTWTCRVQSHPFRQTNERRSQRAFSCLAMGDRKSTRLNSSHVKISYDVYCLK